MESGVVGVRVADEGEFVFGELGFVGVKPKAQLRQENAAAMKLDAKR
jgi:hypothetical protein